MFFLKIAFWVILIIILLPNNSREKNEFYGAAQRSINEITTFCTRNTDVCEKSNSFVGTLRQKFVTTGELVGEVVNGHDQPAKTRGPREETASRGRHRDAPAPQRNWRDGRMNNGTARTASTSAESQDTLTSNDLFPNWDGPKPRAVSYRNNAR
jgi:hypothetical protein